MPVLALFAGAALFPIVNAQLACTAVLSIAGIAGGSASCNIIQTMCSIVNTVTLIIGIIALAMFVIGGLLYGFASFMPAAGNLRASLQGWGISIVIGGVIATVIFILAPFILQMILGNFSTSNAILTSVISAAKVSTVTQLCAGITFNVP